MRHTAESQNRVAQNVLQEEVMEWQPIETAPRDGTWILVTGGTARHEVSDGALEPRVTAAQYTNWLNGRKMDDWNWQFAWFDGGYYGEYDDPTHWMPLPEPPKGNDS